MASGFAKQFVWLGGVHSTAMDTEQTRKMAAKPPPALKQVRSTA